MTYARAFRRFAALLAIGMVVSCSIDQPTSPPAPPPPSADLLGEGLHGVHQVLGGLLSCRPLPYASDSRVIGPAGGELDVGPHTLRIPPGALAWPVRITAVAPSDTVNSVRLFPEGLRFARPAALTMSYANCGLVRQLLPVRIAYTTDDLDILTYLLSIDDVWHRRVTGRLDHFSRYAIAW